MGRFGWLFCLGIFASVLCSCSKINYDYEEPQLADFTYEQLYDWLGKPYAEVAAVCSGYQKAGDFEVNYAQGGVQYYFSMPRCCPSDEREVQLIDVYSDIFYPSSRPKVEKVVVHYVHDLAREVTAPTLFLPLATRLLPEPYAPDAGGVKTHMYILSSTFELASGDSSDPIETQLFPLFYSDEVKKWRVGGGTRLEFEKLLERMNRFVSENRGRIVKATIDFEVIASDWSRWDAGTRYPPTGVEHSVVHYVQRYQRAGGDGGVIHDEVLSVSKL